MHDFFVPSLVSGFCYLLQMYVLICSCFSACLFRDLQFWSSYKLTGHVETQTMQTADCRLYRLCRLSVIFLLVPQFSSKIFTIVSCFPSLCALCITIICCTDVYLQGSWVGNEKIMGSCLPADVKVVSRAFSCAAFTQERAQWRKVSCFFL